MPTEAARNEKEDDLFNLNNDNKLNMPKLPS